MKTTKKSFKPIKIYFFGNQLLEQDSSPLNVLSQLKEKFSNTNFIHLDPTENLPIENHLILIDTIINTNKIQILTEKNIHSLNLTSKSNSPISSKAPSNSSLLISANYPTSKPTNSSAPFFLASSNTLSAITISCIF